MAKTIKQLKNRIRIKKLVKPNAYFLFFGNEHIYISDYGYINDGFKSIKEAIEYANNLTHIGGATYVKNNNFPFS